MSENVKIALIIAVTAIICVSLKIYFSPFNSCVREGGASEFMCARAAAGNISFN